MRKKKYEHFPQNFIGCVSIKAQQCDKAFECMWLKNVDKT